MPDFLGYAHRFKSYLLPSSGGLRSRFFAVELETPPAVIVPSTNFLSIFRAIFWSNTPLRLIVPGALLWLLSGIISTALSYDPGLSLRSLILLIVGLIAGSAVLVGWPPRLWIVAALVFTGALFALYFLFQNDFDYRSKFGLVHWLSALTSKRLPDLGWHKPHPNIAAGVLEVAFPLCMALALTLKALARWLSFAAAALCAYVLFMTESRGAWGALLVALTCTGLLYLYSRRRSTQISRRKIIVAGSLIVSGLIIAAIAIIVVTLNSPALLKSSNRWTVQSGAVSLILDYPFTGAGMDTFEKNFDQYVLFHNTPPEPHAHNLWLNLWVSQGVLGILGYGLITLGTALAVYRAFRTFKRNSPLFWAALAAWLTLLIHGLVDDVHYQSWSLPLLAIIPALLITSANLPPVSPIERLRPARYRGRRLAGIGLALVIILIVLWSPLLSLFQSNMGNIYQAKFDLGLDKSAAVEADNWLTVTWHTWSANPSAIRRVPFFYMTQHNLGRVVAYHQATGTSIAEWAKMAYYFFHARSQFDFANSIYEEIEKLDSANPVAYYNLADHYAIAGNLTQAIIHQQHGLELDNKPAAERYVKLGDWSMRLGDKQAALTNYKRANELDPSNPAAKAALQNLNGQK
jgi:O-antigen ligase